MGVCMKHMTHAMGYLQHPKPGQKDCDTKCAYTYITEVVLCALNRLVLGPPVLNRAPCQPRCIYKSCTRLRFLLLGAGLGAVRGSHIPAICEAHERKCS